MVSHMPASVAASTSMLSAPLQRRADDAQLRAVGDERGIDPVGHEGHDTGGIAQMARDYVIRPWFRRWLMSTVACWFSQRAFVSAKTGFG